MTPPSPAPGRLARLRPWLVLALEAGIVGYIGYRLWTARAQIAAVWDLEALDLAALLALVVAGSLPTALLFQRILRSLGLELRFAEAWTLTVATTLLNYLPLNPGLFVRARVLKRRRGFSYTRYVAMMGATALLGVMASGVLGLAALGWVAPGLDLETLPVAVTALLFAGAVAGPLVLLHLPAARLAGRTGWIADRLRGLLEGWHEIRRSRATLAILCGWSLVQLVVVALRFSICFGAFAMAVGFPGALLFAAVTTVATVVNVTPAGLGVRELLVGLLAVGFGLDFAQGTVAAGLDRAAVLLFVVPVGLASLLYLRRIGLMGGREPERAEVTPDRPGGRRSAG